MILASAVQAHDCNQRTGSFTCVWHYTHPQQDSLGPRVLSVSRGYSMRVLKPPDQPDSPPTCRWQNIGLRRTGRLVAHPPPCISVPNTRPSEAPSGHRVSSSGSSRAVASDRPDGRSEGRAPPLLEGNPRRPAWGWGAGRRCARRPSVRLLQPARVSGSQSLPWVHDFNFRPFNCSQHGVPVTFYP